MIGDGSSHFMELLYSIYKTMWCSKWVEPLQGWPYGLISDKQIMNKINMLSQSHHYSDIAM